MALIYVYSEDGLTRKRMCDCDLYDENGNKYNPLTHTEAIYVYDQSGTRYLLSCCGKEIEDSGVQGTTVVTPSTDITAREEKRQLNIMEGATLQELVDGLNSVGATPRDLISILRAMRSAGALHAQLEVI